MLKRNLFLLILMSVFSGLYGCGEEDYGTVFPEMQVQDSLLFPSIQLGQTEERLLNIENLGGADLIIAEFSFTNETDTVEFSIEDVTMPVIVPPNERFSLAVRYSPNDVGEDRGGLRIINNSRTQEVVVRLITAGATSDLVATPARLELLSEDGQVVNEPIRITNRGNVPIRILNVEMSDDTDPQLSLNEPPDYSAVVSNGEGYEFSLSYTPQLAGGCAGTFEVSYEYVEENGEVSREQQLLPVPVFGRRPAAQISVSPESVVFGAIDEGSVSDPMAVVVTNIGVRPLEIASIAFSLLNDDDNEQFELVNLPELENGPAVLQPEEQLTFSIIYRPTTPDNHEATLQIRSNSAEDGTKLVAVTGRVRRPCIEVLPSEINFGIVALNIESLHSTAQITNCGDLPVDISDIRIAGGDTDFEWAPVGGAWSGSTSIPPLGSYTIEVWYTNRGLAESAMSSGQLVVENNTPDQPELQVPLSVIGGGAPTCELLLLPSRVDFGLVARGRTVTREVDILNRGTGYCDLTAQEVVPLLEIPIPIPGFNEVRFFITSPANLGQIAPSQRVPMAITYQPQTFSADGGKLRLTYNDPYMGTEKTVEADLSGVGGESNIEVIPSRLDFGLVTAGECASREERVTVYNTGIVNLCITNVTLQGPDCSEFLITERPRANQDGCILVTRSAPAEVKLIYQPTNLGTDECNLVFESDANNAPELVVPLDGEGTRTRQQTDVFQQTSGQTVDVLFVVDNSGSMGEEQDNLRDSFNAFISGADQFSNDFQIGVVTMDMQDEEDSGQLKGSTRIVNRGPNASNEFLDNTASRFLGTRGGGSEEGLAAAEAALSDPLSYDTGVACTSSMDCVSPDACIDGFCGGYNRGFLREEAALEIVFVSDEDDQSQGTLNFYVDFFKNLKGYRNEGRMHAHAIVGAENGRASACEGPGGDASRGERYVEVAQRTNGGIYSICDSDFGTPLRMIGNQAFGLPVQFFLSRPALASSISVQVDGAQRNNGWTYDEASNSVIFDMAQVPQPGQTVEISYEAQCFARQ